MRRKQLEEEDKSIRCFTFFLLGNEKDRIRLNLVIYIYYISSHNSYKLITWPSDMGINSKTNYFNIIKHGHPILYLNIYFNLVNSNVMTFLKKSYHINIILNYI